MMFKRVLLLAVALLLFTPAVSAELLVDDGSNSATFDLQSWGATNPAIIEAFRIYRIQDWDGLYFLYCKVNNVGDKAVSVLTANPSYDRDVNLKIGDVVVGSGTAHYNALYNNAGTVTGVQCWLDIDSWHPTGYTGFQYVRIVPSSGTPFNGLKLGGASNSNVAPNYPIGFVSGSYLVGGIHLVRSHYYWENVIDISDEFVSLTRQLDGTAYVSTLQITSDAGYFEDTSPNNIEVPYIGTGTWNVTNPNGRVYSGMLSTLPMVVQPCTINVYDADSRLPLSGSWDYYVVIQGADAVSGSGSGAFAVVDLPATSILQPHLLRVTKEGYVQVPETLALNVPAGGREIPVYLRSTTAPPEEGNVWIGFNCTDADTGSPISSALVNLDGSAQYTGASGYVRFQVPENSSHEWVASSASHWPMGDTVTVGTVDLNVPVELVRKTSDLPRPPLPDLPNFPVIHPLLDPAGFRMQILNVPILGGLASPLLDTMDAIAVGLDDIVQPVLDFVTDPADNVVEVLESVGNQLTVSVATYTDIAGVLLGAVGKLLAVFPSLVVGLVSYNLVLDLVYLLLRGGL